MKHKMLVSSKAWCTAPVHPRKQQPGSSASSSKTPRADVGRSWDLVTISALGYDSGFVAETRDVPSLPDKWGDSRAKFLVSVSATPPETRPLPAVSWDAQSNFSPFLYRDVRRTIKTERRNVDDGELVKPHLDWLGFSHTSFPHGTPACQLGNATKRLSAFPFSAGEDFSLQRLSSGPALEGMPAEMVEKPKRSWKVSRAEICLCWFPGSDDGEDWGCRVSFDSWFWANQLNHIAGI